MGAAWEWIRPASGPRGLETIRSPRGLGPACSLVLIPCVVVIFVAWYLSLTWYAASSCIAVIVERRLEPTWCSERARSSLARLTRSNAWLKSTDSKQPPASPTSSPASLHSLTVNLLPPRALRLSLISRETRCPAAKTTACYVVIRSRTSKTGEDTPRRCSGTVKHPAALLLPERRPCTRGMRTTPWEPSSRVEDQTRQDRERSGDPQGPGRGKQQRRKATGQHASCALRCCVTAVLCSNGRIIIRGGGEPLILRMKLLLGHSGILLC